MYFAKNSIFLQKFQNATYFKFITVWYFFSGVIESGNGFTELNKILGCSNMKRISSGAYRRYELEVGAAIEEACKDSCKKAAFEERKLVIQKIAEQL